jgi:hypothetical protein
MLQLTTDKVREIKRRMKEAQDRQKKKKKNKKQKEEEFMQITEEVL